MTENKTMEQKLRRTLLKNGYSLKKSRKRNWSYDDQCGYMIIDAKINGGVAGLLHDFSLDDVAEWAESMC